MLDLNQKTIAWNNINLAKKQLEIGTMDSVHFANFLLRDLDAIKEAGLFDLAYAIHFDGAAHKNDVLGLIKHLEESLID